MINYIKPFDALLVSSSINIGYLTNFFGFSKDEREAFLLITGDKQYLLTDGRYIEEVKKTVEGFEILEITSTNSLKKILKSLLKKHQVKKLGIEEKNLTVHEQKTLLSHYNDTYHYSDQINKLRSIKRNNEIEAIEKACALGDKTFQYILTKIKQGITEKQLAFEIEYFIKKHGADISFPPIVAFGANSSVPHHQTTNNSRLTTNSIVLLDFGTKIYNYCSDMTRTVFFGKATSEQKRIYKTVLQAQKKAIEYLSTRFDVKTPRMVARQRPRLLRGGEIKAADVDRIARSFIKSQGYPTIPHSLGHGIGLQVHELPRLGPKSKDILKPGMVFSIEPGIYIENWGGVRIEDLVVLTKTGPRLLTKAKKEIIDI
ncbi:aminopeptidase P family protein [Candidatus Microgenomates bacterium]|nr:aminopeptidase P family protein [Candidatus Microgenomates bacterium]